MELFALRDRETERLLAVTEEGKRYTLGDLNAAAERIAGAVGSTGWSLCCVRTPPEPCWATWGA